MEYFNVLIVALTLSSLELETTHTENEYCSGLKRCRRDQDKESHQKVICFVSLNCEENKKCNY